MLLVSFFFLGDALISNIQFGVMSCNLSFIFDCVLSFDTEKCGRLIGDWLVQNRNTYVIP